MVSGESFLIVRGFYDKIIAEGAVGVNTDIIRGMQTSYDQQHDLLVVHSDVVRDGLIQPMEETRYYNDLVASGVTVTTLGRRFDNVPDLSAFTAGELAQASDHARSGQVITSLEEHPLRLINQLGNDLPPLVTFLHRTKPHESGALEYLLAAVNLGRIAVCVTDSEAARDAYEAAGVPQGLISVIPNGIDLERFTPSTEKRAAVRQELQIPSDALTTLYVARFSDEKDVDLFIQSAVHFLEKNPEAHVIAAGAGLSDGNSEMTELVQRRFAQNPSLTNRLHLLGVRSDIDALHASADVLTLTSRTESYPLCLLEAMASGAIPTSTDVGDTRVMLEGRGIITSRDPQDIAQAWVEAHARRSKLAISPQEREALGKPRMLRAYNAVIRSVIAAA